MTVLSALYALTKVFTAAVVAPVFCAMVKLMGVVEVCCRFKVSPETTSDTVLLGLLTAIPLTVKFAFCAAAV